MSAILQETKANLLKELGLNETHDSAVLGKITASEHKYLKDLKINVSNALNAKSLNKKEALFIALSVAVNEKNTALKEGLLQLLEKEGATEAEVAEVYACVSLLNTNNVFYRFRHFIKKEYYETTPAGIKMSIMANPVLGKEFFELLSLVVSSLNGCELCVRSHEEALVRENTSQSRIYDAIRLGAIIKGLSVVI